MELRGPRRVWAGSEMWGMVRLLLYPALYVLITSRIVDWGGAVGRMSGLRSFSESETMINN